MTAYLWTAIALTALVALGALALALGVARQLRELQERASALPFGMDLPTPGDPVPEFTAVTTDGRRVSSDDLAGPDVLMLFFTSSCSSCREELPRLEERLRSVDAAGPEPIAVVIGDPAERAALVTDLQPLARVVAESTHTGLASKFQVHGFPSALVVGGGVVRQAGHGLADLRVGAPA